ncbi:hypothetical protein H6G00_21855 [Leptolyngbya sp. FACHB-541]|uniref:hypothetical protein n=1 Tax=Leptolyngbya sp. FACHB-541 TaxID=2692810 RepID=UPI001685ECBC|nr:hypothetical protein [Leptolyngbya sp. FACHB-541]MBD1999226.1 hypothetical protein [Leptolyngbya sp. FACHB-541]
MVAALSTLGLEFKVVLILWVEQFGDRFSIEAEQTALPRRQLYVAMTCAQKSLYLFGAGQVPLLEELEQSQGFEVVLKG